jgi:hypothetical protein
VPRNTGHVSGFPREHAYVVPQKPDERVFLLRIQVGPDKGRLAGIVVDQLDLLVLVGLDVLSTVLGALGSLVGRRESWRHRPGFAPCELRGWWPLPP